MGVVRLVSERGMKPLHTKWVFKTNTDAANSVERYKAGVIECGNEPVMAWSTS